MIGRLRLSLVCVYQLLTSKDVTFLESPLASFVQNSKNFSPDENQRPTTIQPQITSFQTSVHAHNPASIFADTDFRPLIHGTRLETANRGPMDEKKGRFRNRPEGIHLLQKTGYLGSSASNLLLCASWIWPASSSVLSPSRPSSR